MGSAGGVVAFAGANAMSDLSSGRHCSPDGTGPKASAGKNYKLELNNDMLLGIAELLRNETARNILHSIKLLERPRENLMPSSNGKCTADCDIFNTLGFMDAAGLSRSEGSTMLGFMTMLQYGLYQAVFREHHDCPIPDVFCGKNVNPCDAYPPAKGLP
jgi:hypothetical protein